MNVGAPQASSTGLNNSRESSITVAVRVRPFTAGEENNLIKPDKEQFFLGDGSLSTNASDTPSKRPNIDTPRGIRKIINVVDDKMLIFDPPETNPLIQMQRNAFPNTKMTSRIREHRFVFDKLFDVLASQEDIYHNTTRPLLDSVLDGFNATVFAYGATGCGKTHTILGTPADPGVIFLTMKELYNKIEGLSDTKVFDVSMSFLEIYNETIRDLLNPETHFKKLILREDANKKISVSHLLSHKPNSVEEVMDLILTGNQNRTSSPTEANATSSRSHAVLQINVVQKNRTADISEEHTFATLSIIDLAGSERAAATKNRGARLNEGANINKSLLALGNCINALCDPRRRNHIPYRDSKLTRLLKFSLGGNCKTVMIVCVSPLSQHYDETLNTLKYADRAKEIKTKLVRNQHNLDRHVGSYLKMITQQKQEIEDLRLRELKVVELTIFKQNSIYNRCLDITLENIKSLEASLAKQHQEKWRKYFILAKRKLLLLQKLELENLLDSYNLSLKRNNMFPNLHNFAALSEKLVSKFNSNITDLETQYSRPNELDYIFNNSTQQVLKKLREQEGWSEHNTLIFGALVSSLKESLEKEILFNSSILFDHLVHEIDGFDFLSSGFIHTLSAYTDSGKENIDERTIANLTNVLDDVINILQQILSGDFDTAIENITSTFMQKKMKDSETNFGKPNFHENSSTTLQKPRDCKRGSNSPLKSSPPRDFKKSITKKPLSKIPPPVFDKQSKKVRWDVPNQDSAFTESDVSVDDTSNTMLKSDIEDDSPVGNNIIDKSSIIDDLDLKFDPTLDSPPLAQLLKDNMNNNLMAELSKNRGRNKKIQPLTNRKLSTNENSDSLTKLPLLNKQASTKIVSSLHTNDSHDIINTSPNYISGATSNSKLKMNSLGAPSRVINRYKSYADDEDTRDIESNGSEKVE